MRWCSRGALINWSVCYEPSKSVWVDGFTQGMIARLRLSLGAAAAAILYHSVITVTSEYVCLFARVYSLLQIVTRC